MSAVVNSSILQNAFTLAPVQETGRFGVLFSDNTPETRMSVGGGVKPTSDGGFEPVVDFRFYITNPRVLAVLVTLSVAKSLYILRFFGLCSQNDNKKYQTLAIPHRVRYDNIPPQRGRLGGVQPVRETTRTENNLRFFGLRPQNDCKKYRAFAIPHQVRYDGGNNTFTPRERSEQNNLLSYLLIHLSTFPKGGVAC